MFFLQIFKRRCRIWIMLPLLSLIALSSAGQSVSLELKNDRIQKAFQVIESQTSFRFVYSVETLKDANRVSIKVDKEPIQKALTMLFQDQPLAYFIEDNYIIVKRKAETGANDSRQLEGIILDENSQPVVGATVALKGTSVTTASDGEGKFRVRAEGTNTVLLISSIGYLPKEVNTKGKSPVEIKMTVAVQTLDETIIKGYYTTSKRFNTGSVSKVNAATIENQAINNPLQAVQGRMAGVFVTQSSGIAGGAMNLQVRGQNSLRSSGNNPPLYN